MQHEVTWTLPFPSQEIERGPELSTRPGMTVLRIDSEDTTCEIRFHDVVAFQFTGFDACEADHVKAYDKLLKLGRTPYVERLRKASRRDRKAADHYRIFFDDVGCYDFVAHRVEIKT